MLVKEKEILSEVIHCDFKDWLFYDESSENLKKWIRYCACDYGDADQVIKENGWFRQLKWSDKYIDCIFSFKTYFYGFLRKYMNGSLGEMPSSGYILDHYDRLFSYKNRMSILNEHYDLSEEEAQVFWMRLNEFAKLTHTIGNYMPCPNAKYNRYKGYGEGNRIFQDRIDLLYREIQKSSEKEYVILNEGDRSYYKKWFNENLRTLFIDEMVNYNNYFCPMKRIRRFDVCYMETSEHIRNYSRYLEQVNKLIKTRGERIVEQYNKGTRQ